MKYGNVDSNGEIIGFYDPEIHETIPEPSYEIDDDTWQKHLGDDKQKWNGIGWESYVPYPYKDWTLEQAKRIKVQECEQYAETLIENSKSNPTQGVSVDPIMYSKRIKAREKDKANKLAGEIILTQEEKDQAKTDQKLSEYEVKCFDASDKAIKEVEKETTIDDIMAIDVITITTWPVWVAPI